MITFIYKITDCDNKVYVGKTTKSLKYRLQHHQDDKRRNQPISSTLLNLDDCEIVELERITSTDKEIIKELEKKHIQSYPNSVNIKLKRDIDSSERSRIQAKNYYNNNIEKERAKKLQYYHNNPQKFRDYYQKNKERNKIRYADKAEKNRERSKELNRKRRQKEREEAPYKKPAKYKLDKIERLLRKKLKILNKIPK